MPQAFYTCVAWLWKTPAAMSEFVSAHRFRILSDTAFA
jgi:hypothetical protein